MGHRQIPVINGKSYILESVLNYSASWIVSRIFLDPTCSRPGHEHPIHSYLPNSTSTHKNQKLRSWHIDSCLNIVAAKRWQLIHRDDTQCNEMHQSSESSMAENNWLPCTLNQDKKQDGVIWHTFLKLNPLLPTNERKPRIRVSVAMKFGIRTFTPDPPPRRESEPAKMAD